MVLITIDMIVLMRSTRNEKTAPLWQTNFTDCERYNHSSGARRSVSVHQSGGGYYIYAGDRYKTRSIVCLARTKEPSSGAGPQYIQRLHALDVTTGKELSGSPVIIKASSAAHNRADKRNEVTFDSLVENPRAALLLVNGIVYLTWGSSCDAGDYHGWVMAYDAHTLSRERPSIHLRMRTRAVSGRVTPVLPRTTTGMCL